MEVWLRGLGRHVEHVVVVVVVRQWPTLASLYWYARCGCVGVMRVRVRWCGWVGEHTLPR